MSVYLYVQMKIFIYASSRKKANKLKRGRHWGKQKKKINTKVEGYLKVRETQKICLEILLLNWILIKGHMNLSGIINKHYKIVLIYMGYKET